MPISTWEIEEPGALFAELVKQYLMELDEFTDPGDDPVNILWIREFSEYDELGRGEVTVTVNYLSYDGWIHNHLFNGTRTEFFEILTKL